MNCNNMIYSNTLNAIKKYKVSFLRYGARELTSYQQINSTDDKCVA